MPPTGTPTTLDASLREVIDEYGWAIFTTDLTYTEHVPVGERSQWTATVGLTLLGLPELVVGGELDERSRRALLALVVHRCTTRGAPSPDETFNLDHVPDVAVRLMPVDLERPAAKLLATPARELDPAASMLQVIYADDNGRWPWEHEAARQPTLIGDAAPPSGVVAEADDFKIIATPGPTPEFPPMLTTKGLVSRFGVELLMFGHPTQVEISYISTLASLDRLSPGDEHPVENTKLYLADVDPGALRDPTVPRLQVVPADASGLFPWQDGCDPIHIATHPALYLTP